MRNSIICAALLLSACASVGTNYDEQRAAELRPGMSKQAVIAALGNPNSIVTLQDGRQQLTWVHSTGSMFGAKARSITLPFGRDGTLLQIVGGAAIEDGSYPGAAATSSTVQTGGLTSHVQTTSTVSAPSMPGPATHSPRLPPGVKQLGPDIWLYPAPAASGYCIQAPADYQGSGSSSRPAITGGMPRCSNVSK